MGPRNQQVHNFEEMCARYLAGEAVKEIAPASGVSEHTLRRRFLAAGIMRSPAEASPLTWAQGKMDNRRTRKGVPQSEEGKRKQSISMRQAWDGKARGWRINSDGYKEYTRGEMAGRKHHVVTMEDRIGRRLLADECVHHIDGDKLNNDISNLALMTFAAHAKLHRREDALAGKYRQRNQHGQFTGEIQCSHYS